MSHTAAHCNTLQHTLQHTATHCNTRCNMLQHTNTHTQRCTFTDTDIHGCIDVRMYICETQRIHTWDMTHLYVWHDSSICVTRLVHRHSRMYRCTYCTDVRTYIHSLHNSFHMCDMTHSYVRHDPFTRVIRFIHIYDMTHFYVRQIFFIREKWLIHMWDMTLLYVKHDFSTDIHGCIDVYMYICT